MAVKLTDAFLRGVPPKTFVRDTLVTGLAVRRQTDALSFVFVSEAGGKQKMLTLGRYPGMSLADARAQASALRGNLDAGRPLEAERPLGATVNDLLDAYLADKTEDVAWFLSKLREPLGTTKLTAVTRGDIQRVVDRIESASVRAAVAKYAAAAWKWGIPRDLTAAPLILAKPPAAEPRQRTLSVEELRALMRYWLPRGADKPARSGFGAIMALCTLTLARRSEIAELTWDEIRGDRIVLAPSRTKQGRTATLHLSPLAQQILASVPRFHDSIVFPVDRARSVGGKASDRPGRAGRGFMSGFGPAVRRMQLDTGISEFTPHDLRRSGASWLAQTGTPPHLVEHILNHQTDRLVRTYQVVDYTPEIQAALARWALEIG